MSEQIGDIGYRTARVAGSDCTAPYDIKLNRDCTVEEFIETVLKEYKDEWGSFNIVNGAKSEYKNGVLIDEIPKEILSKNIKVVKGVGGWTCMDYQIWLMPDEDSVTEVTDVDELIPQLIINNRDEEIIISRESYEALLANPEDGTYVRLNNKWYRLMVARKVTDEENHVSDGYHG